MTTVFASYPAVGGGVAIYPTIADFPASAINGTLAVAADTDWVYVFDGTTWQLVAKPGGSSSAISGLTGDVSATGPGVVPATVNSVGGKTAASIGSTVDLVATATPNATGSSLVERDASGNFSANTITASLTGHASLDIPLSQKAAANGVATLDVSGKIPASQLPSVVFQYQGSWNPTTNTPTLSDATGTAGYVYYVSAAFAGPIAGLNSPTMYNFQVGDLILYSASASEWELTTPAAGVQSVNGAQGVVTVNAINQLTGDVTAGPALQSQSKVATIATNAVTNAKLAQVPANTLKGNNTGVTADPTDLTVAQLQSMLAIPTLPVSVPSGGTGLTSLTANNVIIGNGSSSPTFVAPGASGNMLTSNGTTWVSSPAATSGTVTSVNASGGTTGFSFTGGPITSSGTLTLTGTLAIASGGTGVTSATTAPTASSFAAWDANKNLSADNFISGYQTIVSSASLVTLTVDSPQQTYVTGTAIQTIRLPDVTTLPLGFTFKFTNLTTQQLVIQISTATELQRIAPNTWMQVTCVNNTTNALTSWNPLYLFNNSSVNAALTALPIASGGTGVKTATTAPTGGAFAAWDTNINLRANNMTNVLTSIVTANGTTTLTITSSHFQQFTGTSNQTVILPSTSIAVGYQYYLINNSTGVITVNASGGGLVQTIQPNTRLIVTSIAATPTLPSQWNADYIYNLSSNNGAVTALPVGNGGTGATSLTANNVLLGNGTSALQTVAPGANGNILTSNGTSWVSTTPATSGTVTSVNASGGTTGLSFSGGPITSSGTLTLSGTLNVANGGTGSTTLPANSVLVGNGTSALQSVAPGTSGNILTSDGTSWVSSAPATSGTVTSVNVSGGTTGLTFTGGPITSSGTITASGTLAVANGGTGVTSSTGTGSVVLSTSPTLVTPDLGTPSAIDLSNGTNLDLATGVVGTLQVTQGGTGVTTSTGSGSVVLSDNPVLNSPDLGQPSAVDLTNGTSLPLSTGVSGTLPVANGGTGLATLPQYSLLVGNFTGNLLSVAPGASGNILQSNGSQWQSVAAPAAGAFTTIVSALDYVAANYYEIFANTTSNTVTVSFAAAPAIGNRIRIIDYAGTWNTHAAYFDGGEEAINGVVGEPLVLDLSWGWVELIYTNSVVGWRTIS